MDKEYYSINEFANLFSISEHIVRKGIKEGKIRAFKLSESIRSPYRIHKSEVYRIQAEGMRKSRTDIYEE